MSSKKPIPKRKPTAAGTTDHAPLSAFISIAGISNDHTEAATITPDAKPNSDFCRRADISFFIMNTNAEPIIVPNSGNSRPIINIVITFIIYFYLNDTKIMQRYNNVTTLAIPKNKVLK